MYDFIRIAKALTDENRLKMLKLLTEKDICVCEMNRIFPLSNSQISRNLKVLLEAGLLKRWHEGKCVLYVADRNSQNEHSRAIIEWVSTSFNDDESIRKLREELQRAALENIRGQKK